MARTRFQVERMHAEQEEAIEAVLGGRDTLAVLPTGFGKSLIYQVAAMLTDRPTVVISPLIALMADQEKSLRKRNVPVVRLDSTVRVAERRANLERLTKGGRLIVLTTPETLESPATRPYFVDASPWLLCVDEAHCISEWGHDFRPSYLRLGAERAALGDPVVLGLTATATPRVREDVVSRLAMRDPAIVTASPHRANLRLEVELTPGDLKPERAGKLIRRLRRPGIVYCSTTLAVDRVWAALQKARIPSLRYHGRMRKLDRESSQRRYMSPGNHSIMVATSAFGMGIDKSNIRTILHYQTPGSLEQYVQEAGRAGRDGRPSRCVLLFDPADLAIQEHLQRRGRASPRQLLSVARALESWMREHRPVAADALALSAGVPKTVCRALCGQLEELGVVELDTERRYRALVAPSELVAHARNLARRLETQRRTDEERLEMLAAYAHSLECRSVFIRRYFGEPDPAACGNCDRCGERRPPRRVRRSKKKRGRTRAKTPRRRKA